MWKWECGMRKKNKNEIKLRSGATSLFDVQRWAFDVHLSNQPLITIIQAANVYKIT
jgi:hypothetical protein